MAVSYNSSVKFYGKKKFGATIWPCYIQSVLQQGVL